MATALTHAEVELGLTFVHKRMLLYMEVNNVLDLHLSLKAVMSRSAQVGYALPDAHKNHVTVGWFISINNDILILIHL